MAETSVYINGTRWELTVSVDVYHKFGKELIEFCDDKDYLVAFEKCNCTYETCKICELLTVDPYKLYPASFNLLSDKSLTIASMHLAPTLEESLAAVTTLKGLGYSHRGGSHWAPPHGRKPEFKGTLFSSEQARQETMEMAANDMGFSVC